MESLELILRGILAFLWLLHFGLPGLLLIAMYAFVERKVELEEQNFRTPFFSGKQMETAISWVFILAIVFGFVLARLSKDPLSFVPYVYAACAVAIAGNGTMKWVMRRIVRSPAVSA